MDTKQARAIYVAQQLALNLATLKSINNNLQSLYTEYNGESLSGVWAAMATAAQNTDGSLGAADGSPNAAHPITVGNINKSSTTLVAAVTLAIQLNNFLTNQTTIQANYMQTISDMASS